jgi:hypothetical protein
MTHEHRDAVHFWHRLEISSFEQLLEHEAVILERIKSVPNGGHLFMVHPFLLLYDVGVYLSEAARAEILRRETYLSALSELPYYALKASREPQGVTVNLLGLFERRSR